MGMARGFLVFLVIFALTACGRNSSELKAVFIGDKADLFATGNRLPSAAQHVRAATEAGLVALDEKGEIVPALADRWIVTDDGRSFIFRLRDGTWPDGRELSGESVRIVLGRALRVLRGTSLGLDLAPVSDVRAMAGRVIEIRLSEPVPSLLQLLAQPELVLVRGKGGMGPMTLQRRGDEGLLTLKRPSERGLPEPKDWQARVRPVVVRPASPARAVALFAAGDVDLVLGGRLATLPLAPTGPLSRGTVQLDPAIGLFGLQVRNANGFLAAPEDREALAMAIDRQALIAPFNIAGWLPTTRVVAPALPGDPGLVAERWTAQSIDELRLQAAARVASWRRAHGGQTVTLSLALPDGPGIDEFYAELTRQLTMVGITLRRMPEDARADLVLVDRVARYAAPRWFLNQFACSLRQGLCDPAADALVAEADLQADTAARDSKLAEAEAKLTLANVFIPLASPLRWSLVRSNVTGFYPNAWAFHPLPAFAEIPK